MLYFFLLCLPISLLTVVLIISVQIGAQINDHATRSISKNILLTGFEPFYIYDVNPSELVVNNLNGTVIGNHSIIGLVLPVNFSTSFSQITMAIDTYNPVLVLSLGLNGGARWLQVENIGLNFRKRPRSDPLWFLPKKLDPEGPLFRISTVPVDDIIAAVCMNGIPVRKSFYAGTYICNSVLYQTLNYIKKNEEQIPMGFIHLPPLYYQEPYGMNLSAIQNGVEAAILTCVGE